VGNVILLLYLGYLINICTDELRPSGRAPLMAGARQLLQTKRTSQTADRFLQQIHLRHGASCHRIWSIHHPSQASVQNGRILQR